MLNNGSDRLAPMRLAVISCFLNEEAYLSTFLESLAGQSREPEDLLLVDDGSSDASLNLATEFARGRPYARVLSRPRRAAQRDRLAAAAELEAFCWALETLDTPWDVVVKLDADLRLTPSTFAELVARFSNDPKLGIAGFYHSVMAADGQSKRERCPAGHVHGSGKFYRRECLAEISPVPQRLGWDTCDEIRARMHGWRTESYAMPDGDPIHLRPIATHDGMLRGYRRIGMSAYGYGAQLWWVLLGAAGRLHERPRILGALNYFAGWVWAALRRAPRADARQRAFVAREHRARVLSILPEWPFR
jgi:glycosyltransferase involved in cell wall biosynthesis